MRIALALVLLALFTAARADVSPAVGDEAPDFTLGALDGAPVSLADLHAEGPVVLIVLRGWPGYQCPICSSQVAGYLSDQQDFAERGATVLMVYPGPSDYLDDHADEFVRNRVFPPHYRFVTDPGYDMVNRYGLRWDQPGETAYPSTFVLDQGGQVRFARVSRSHGGRVSSDEALRVLDER